MFGGTFDPIHIGHLVAADGARYALRLDYVLFMVACMPWQKAGVRQVSPPEDRYAVVAETLSGIEGFEASRIEIDRGGPSYTVDTVEELQRLHPGASIFLVVGADLVADLGSWHRAGELGRMVTLAVVNRPGLPSPDAPEGWEVTHVEVPSLEVSSTDLRARVAAGRPVRFLVPEEAIRCIRRLGLYAGAG